MNMLKKLTLVAALAFAAAAPAIAQTGPGGGVGTGDGTGGAAGTSEGGGGTTGWLANSPSMRFPGRFAATHILPADGSNTEASMTVLAARNAATALGAGPGMPTNVERDGVK